MQHKRSSLNNLPFMKYHIHNQAHIIMKNKVMEGELQCIKHWVVSTELTTKWSSAGIIMLCIHKKEIRKCNTTFLSKKLTNHGFRKT